MPGVPVVVSDALPPGTLVLCDAAGNRCVVGMVQGLLMQPAAVPLPPAPSGGWQLGAEQLVPLRVVRMEWSERGLQRAGLLGPQVALPVARWGAGPAVRLLALSGL